MDQVTIATRIEQYLLLRKKRQALKEAYEAQEAPFAEMENLLSGLILRHLEAIGADNIKTKNGTCYRSERSTASVSDKQAFMAHVKETGKFELLDCKANAPAVKAYVMEHQGHLPPGVNLNTMVTLGVRSPPKRPITVMPSPKSTLEDYDGGATAVSANSAG